MDTRTLAQAAGVDDSSGASSELRRLLTILKRALFNWRPSAIFIALGILAGVGVAFIKMPSFRSETIVIYRQGVRMSQEGGGASVSLGVRLQEMLMARSRLESLVTELGLYEKVQKEEGMVEAIEAFRSDITFKARSVDTFSIGYKGATPETAQKVTDRLAQSLIEENQKLRIEQARTQREFLEAEKGRSETELKGKERELALFLSEHPEFALDANAQNAAGAGGAAVRAANQPVGPGGKDAATLALERQAARNRALLDGTTSPTRPEARADPELESGLRQAESDVANAKADLANKKSRFTDSHPDVVAAAGRVADAEGRRKAAEDKVRASQMTAASQIDATFNPEQAKEKLKKQLNGIEAEIAQRRKAAEGKEKVETGPNEEANRIVGTETDFARLTRDVSEARERMNELERNYFRAQIEASSSLGGYSDQVVVLDPAYLPSRPNPPGKSLIVVIALAASLVFAFLIAIMRALLDNRIYEESDLLRVAPVLAVVPRAGAKRWWRR